MRLVEKVHRDLATKVKAGDYCIDMTIGNGWDALYLSNIVGENGRVYGFDLQEKAILNTKQKLSNEGKFENLKIFACCHSQFDDQIPTKYKGKIQAVVFNLGYLPGSNKSIVTQSSTTLIALSKVCQWMKADGIITIVGYRGHRFGKFEVQSVIDWLTEKPHEVHQTYCSNSSESPILLTIENFKMVQPSPLQIRN